MSLPNVATQREFCRRLFRAATANTTTARHTFLDELADEAILAQTDGKALIGTAVSGAQSAQFELFQNWSPGDLLSLIDAARTWADETTVEEALALIGAPVTETHFECGLER